MKVLLVGINAKYIHTNLAIRSLRANAGEYRHMVDLCEYTINHQRQDIFARLYEEAPDVIGFSCYLWNIEYVISLAEDMKKILPDIRIFVGGPEVSYHPEQVLEEHPDIDLIMLGEGERTFHEYLAYLNHKIEDIGDIPGLAFRKNGSVVRTAPRQGMNMDDLVFPYEDLEGLENRILYYESIRGCPFSCSYCLSSIEKSLRIKSAEKTKKELDFFLERKVPQVQFVDRTFNCNRDYAYEIWSYIHEHDNGVTNFHFEISGDLLREKDMELLKTFRPGLVQFEIGVQSTNPRTIKAIRRTMNLPLLAHNVTKVRETGNIHQHLDLIAGLPHEDYESFRKSFNEVYGLKPDQFQLGFLKVLSGSYMNEKKEDYEIAFSSRPPYEVYSTKWLPYKDVLQLKEVEEMVEVYYNSFQFVASMDFLVPKASSAFDFYRELGAYHKKNGLFECQHSRLERFEILWRFATEQVLHHKEEVELFRDVLTFDLYTRDYVKNPPSFVVLRSDEEKRAIRQFFDQECEQPRYLEGYDNLVTKQLFNMIYIGAFGFSYEEWKKTGHIVPAQRQYLLFDYKKRNPLNHSAKIQEIEFQAIDK
ncbi:MAG: B12-binding domain-containing radical SAM protein [Eubacterium sp.]|nr:B12-binding domain-containing radical SAM protein [Eubacterium sp.]